MKLIITASIAAEETFDGITLCLTCAECGVKIDQYVPVEKFKPTAPGMIGMEMESNHRCSDWVELK